MIKDKNRVFDGWLTLEGGVDAGRMPDSLDVNQAVSAKNITFRGGTMSTRPGFRKLDEEFPAGTGQVWCFNEPHTFNPDSSFIAGEYKPNNVGINGLGACVFTAGASGDITVTASSHGLIAGQKVTFLTSGTLPASIHPSPHQYFVLGAGLTSTKFHISETLNGAKITFATAGTGTHRAFLFGSIARWFVNEDSNYIYKHGILQCAAAYSPHNGEDCIVALIGGRLFKIVPRVTTAKVTEVVIDDKPKSLRNMKRIPIGYMCQADKWLIAQDGNSRAIIFDSVKARRAKTTVDADHTEIPTGTMMAYGMGRLVVIVNQRDVAFGDLYGSHNLPDPADSLILFTERNFLAEGFDAAIPFQQGVATGMIFFPQLDTSTGNGQLMVFAERGATSFFLSLDRTLWKSSSFQILSLLTTGLRGHRSIAVVNEDLWFRSDDGMRSWRQARSEQSGWAHIPLSTNVRQYFENDMGTLLKFCSSMYFDNRVLVSTSPMWNNGRPIHWGSVVVDFDILSSFGQTPNVQSTKPAWEGQWLSTKFLPIQLLTGTFGGVTRSFIFGMDSHGENQLFELSVDDHDDFGGELINWELVSRTFDFNKLNPQDSTVFTENELYDGDLWLKEIIE
jgi:hypothetical protein